LTLIVLLSFARSHVVDPETLQVKSSDTKYRNKEQLNSDSITFGRDATTDSSELECHLDVDILWKHELGTPVYNVPTICDLYSDGKKEILVPTSNNYIEAIDSNGFKAIGWPFAFADSTFQSSALLYDKNKDGIQEILVTTQNAEIVFIDVFGIPLYGATLKVPPMNVKKDWFTGLDIPGIIANMQLNTQGRKLLSLEHQSLLFNPSSSSHGASKDSIPNSTYSAFTTKNSPGKFQTIWRRKIFGRFSWNIQRT